MDRDNPLPFCKKVKHPRIQFPDMPEFKKIITQGF